MDEIVQNGIDVDPVTSFSGEMNTEKMTTIYTEAPFVVTKLGTLQPEDITQTIITDEDELPLCSDVVTSPPKIGVGLLSKFGISPSTIAPVPCRDDDDSTTPISIQSSTTTTLISASTTSEFSGNSGAGGLLSSLADKFGK